MLLVQILLGVIVLLLWRLCWEVQFFRKGWAEIWGSWLKWSSSSYDDRDKLIREILEQLRDRP